MSTPTMCAPPSAKVHEIKLPSPHTAPDSGTAENTSELESSYPPCGTVGHVPPDAAAGVPADVGSVATLVAPTATVGSPAGADGASPPAHAVSAKAPTTTDTAARAVRKLLIPRVCLANAAGDSREMAYTQAE